jgi:hypothetical protein
MRMNVVYFECLSPTRICLVRGYNAQCEWMKTSLTSLFNYTTDIVGGYVQKAMACSWHVIYRLHKLSILHVRYLRVGSMGIGSLESKGVSTIVIVYNFTVQHGTARRDLIRRMSVRFRADFSLGRYLRTEHYWKYVHATPPLGTRAPGT